MDRHESITAPPGSVTRAGHSCVHCHESITARPVQHPANPGVGTMPKGRMLEGHRIRRRSIPTPSTRAFPSGALPTRAFRISGSSHQSFSIRSCSRLRFPLQGLFPPGLFHQILLPATLPASRAPPRGSSHQGFASRVLSTRTSRFKGSSPRFLAPGLSASGALPTKVPRIRALPIRDLNLSDVDSSRITASISEARSSQPLGYGRGEVDAAVSELPEISGARIWEGIVV